MLRKITTGLARTLTSTRLTFNKARHFSDSSLTTNELSTDTKTWDEIEWKGSTVKLPNNTVTRIAKGRIYAYGKEVAEFDLREPIDYLDSLQYPSREDYWNKRDVLLKLFGEG